MSVLRDILAKAVESEASDIHLKAGQKPFYRIHSEIREAPFAAVSETEIRAIALGMIPPHSATGFEREHEADFSHTEPGVGRFRVNVFLASGVPALALRYVKTRVPAIADISLPLSLRTLASVPRGIIIVSGPTGSGKSTTLAAVINEINCTQETRIITIEDPIEYLFEDVRSVVTQREVGLDTLSFSAALRHVIRQDPDVIVIGEMRDPISFRTALAAAETGHLVLTTLHAGTAPIAITRILEFFPATERDQVRMALAQNLHAVICQRLMGSTRGGVIPAVEIMINTPTVRKLLEKDKLDVLSAAIETGGEDGMQTFNQSIYQSIRAGLATEKEGMLHATNPAALKMNLQGIFLDEGKRILAS